ncbi:hypothetical protein H0A70_18320 [Alcaligenaceae bacterium]|uniref:hypothetical protein n=1 Tax=Parapusillimonas sp. JC17 TaxID=3445768 RepID=UPI0015D30197|nr:hypothetical protein [Alcaligenaceae bacterium]
MDNNQYTRFRALDSLSATFSLGFKFLAWINGLGVLLLVFCSLGIFESAIELQWLRWPLAAYLAGLTLAALGLLWTYPALASLLGQAVSGRVRRTHWLPMFCIMLAYGLSMMAFVAACWFTFSVGGFFY